LTFDSKLTWRTHLCNLKAECQRRLNIIKSIASCNWGADKTTILNSYKALVRSKLDYGSIVYASAKKYIIDIINPIHTAGLRLAIGAFRTSPTNSILAESSESPLNIRREKLLLFFACKIASQPTNPVYQNIFTDKYTDISIQKPSLPIPIYTRLKNILNNTGQTFPTVITTSALNKPPWLPYTSSPIDDSLTFFSKESTNPNTYLALFREL
ncbi:hypothetical protein X777_06661, partial [Ooceraea biroi]